MKPDTKGLRILAEEFSHSSVAPLWVLYVPALCDRIEALEAQLEEANRLWAADIDAAERELAAKEAETVRRIVEWMRAARTPHAQADAIERGDWRR